MILTSSFAGITIVFFKKSIIMKVKLLAAAGAAVIVAAIYYFKNRKTSSQNSLPGKEAERHHLTNVFSKAKQVAIGN
jgi:hypothetical protein